MFLVSTSRILKFSWQHFWRNIWLSIVTMTIIVLTLFSLTTLVLVNVIADYATGSIKDTIDVSLYFDDQASEESVQLLQTELEKIEEVREIKYISPQNALDEFKKAHKGNETIEATLLEFENNPLGATLVLEAYNVEQYPVIMEKIKEMKADELVEKIDYEDHQLLIGRINDFTKKIKTFGFIISAIFIFIAILTVFNTIRMGIYIHRKEIGIMRLVGANNWYIRTPFILEGLFYAALSCIIFWIIVFVLLHFFGPKINSFFTEINFDIVKYMMANFFNIFGFEFIIIAVVNMISALIAMGKYLRV
ncbi:MAG: permease-like cell division protein FtsX [Candidatus Kuenenbacteria bacterium]